VVSGGIGWCRVVSGGIGWYRVASYCGIAQNAQCLFHASGYEVKKLNKLLRAKRAGAYKFFFNYLIAGGMK